MQNGKSFIKRHYAAIRRIIIMLAYSLILPILVEWTARNSIIEALKWAFLLHVWAYLFTAAFFMLLQFFFFTLLRRSDIPVLIVGIPALTMAIANHYKLLYRSEPLFPWDIGSIGAAMDISKEVTLVPTVPVVVTPLIMFAIFAFLLIFRIRFLKKGYLRKYIKNKLTVTRAGIQAAASLIVCVVFFVFVFTNAYVTEFFGIKESAFRQPLAYTRNGVVESFCLNMKYITPEKPDDYKSTSVTKAASEIKPRTTADTGKIKPNIIFLMSESYGDISLCKNVTYYDDIFYCTQFLKDNFISGSLLTTQYGGGTCNSEFEVLTGHSMCYLPSGCTPYQQYFNEEQICYPKYLKSLGYNTVAIHSYGREFWNRDDAYPNMGFDKFLAEESFVDPLRRRGLIKDDELVDKIIEEYEANLSTGKPFFNFSVSMQNHGSFTNGQYLEDYRVNLSCDALDEEQEGILITYATGIRDANIALDNLIGYFQEIDEPTIICMFGDHLGSLGGSDEIYIKSGYMGDPETDPESQKLKYSVPFFVWDNFTNADFTFTAANMSLYNLIPSICDWYDLDRPLYFDFLLDQSEYYRGQGLGVYLDEYGNTVTELGDEAKEYMKKHKLFQYDLMFGKHYGMDLLYNK